VESSTVGKGISNNYRKYAPEIAQQISKMPKTSAFLRKLFVLPAIKLSKNPGRINNFLLWMIYFSGSFFARLVVVLNRVRK